MSQLINSQVLLNSRPKGIPQAENFTIATSPVVAPKDGEVLIRNCYLSVEPAMRGWICDAGNYSEPVGINTVMRSLAVGEIIESKDPAYKVGQHVLGMFGWQDYATIPASGIDRVIDTSKLPMSTALGILGINGLAAYFALLEVGLPKAGDTVLVSTAAGSVGSCVAQIAKIKGCKTIGITSSPEKVELCTNEFGYDKAVNYNSPSFAEDLASACTDGVDVYFDNTSGRISDAALTLLNQRARVVICGTASISQWDPIPHGPRVERHMLVKRARMEGFVIFDYADRYHEGVSQLSEWILEGRLHYREEIKHGIEEAPDSIAALYRGDNLGKRLIKLAD